MGPAALLPLAALLLSTPSAATPERGMVATAHLPRPVPVSVLLPPSYRRDPSRRYPVVYFLHDGRGDENVLFRRGIARALAAEMEDGSLPELLVVCPRGTGSWFVDAYGPGKRYAAFLTDDLVPWVDGHYRTIASRDGRAAVGISMGGYGAIHWGLVEPRLFASVGGLSPAVEQLTWQTVQAFPFFIRHSFTQVFGASPTANNLRDSDLYEILLARPALAREAPPVFVRCGIQDKYRLAEIVPFFGKFLKAMDVPNEVVLEPGVHDWPYWKKSFPLLLRSVAARLSRGAP